MPLRSRSLISPTIASSSSRTSTLTSLRDTPGSSASMIHASSVSSMSTGGVKKPLSAGGAPDRTRSRSWEVACWSSSSSPKGSPAPDGGSGGLTSSHGQSHDCTPPAVRRPGAPRRSEERPMAIVIRPPARATASSATAQPTPARSKPERVVQRPVPGAYGRDGEGGREEHEVVLDAALGGPQSLARVNGPHRRDHHRRDERSSHRREEPGCEERATDHLGTAGEERHRAARAHPLRLEEGRGSRGSVAAEGPEQLLRPVAHEEQADREANDQQSKVHGLLLSVDGGCAAWPRPRAPMGKVA